MHPFVVPAIVSGLLTILVLHWVPRLYIKRVDRIRQAAATVPLAPAVQLLTVPRTSERRKRINAGAVLMGLLAIFGGIPLVIVSITRQWPFGIPGACVFALYTCAIAAGADPALPCKLRQDQELLPVFIAADLWRALGSDDGQLLV